VYQNGISLFTAPNLKAQILLRFFAQKKKKKTQIFKHKQPEIKSEIIHPVALLH
jgi:hypothetical protein